VGTWISGCTESTTLCYFLFFVDKFKLEFKVINKDKPINEYKEKYNVCLINEYENI